MTTRSSGRQSRDGDWAAAPKGSVWTRLSAGKPSGARSGGAEFVFASSVEDAVAQFAVGDAAIVCGGTAHALRRERSGYPFAKRLVAIGRIPELNTLSINEDGVLHMGAAVCQEKLYANARLRERWRAIDDALEAVGHTRIRQMITVGGSVGPLIGGFDLSIALLALHARVTVAGPQGRRTLTLEDAFRNRFGKGEIVVSVEVDAQPARSGSSFQKYMARGVLEIPTVNTAARVTVDANGRCTEARIVVGSVSWKPIVLDLDALRGQCLDLETARAAARPVHALVEPVADVRGSSAYEREMAVEFAARALMTAWQRATA